MLDFRSLVAGMKLFVKKQNCIWNKATLVDVLQSPWSRASVSAAIAMESRRCDVKCTDASPCMLSFTLITDTLLFADEIQGEDG